MKNSILIALTIAVIIGQATCTYAAYTTNERTDNSGYRIPESEYRTTSASGYKPTDSQKGLITGEGESNVYTDGQPRKKMPSDDRIRNYGPKERTK